VDGRRTKARDAKEKREQAFQGEVDRILDKVRDQGMQSLTRQEKKTLSEATERRKRG
jgi:hypothetical protein